MDRYFCTKCKNIYKFESEQNKLYKKCRVCNYRVEADKDDFKIISEDYVKKGESYEYYLGSVIKDNTFPLVEKNGKLYTLYVEPSTLRHLYISHEDNKAYESIPD